MHARARRFRRSANWFLFAIVVTVLSGRVFYVLAPLAWSSSGEAAEATLNSLIDAIGPKRIAFAKTRSETDEAADLACDLLKHNAVTGKGGS